MTLLPRSLFSRLVLVLLGGLIVAQLLSLTIHMHERGRLLSQASGMQSAQRIADIVKLLESLSVSERHRMVQILSAPPLTISLSQGPLAAAGDNADSGARATLFRAMVRRFLGDGWPVVVSVTDSTAPGQHARHGIKGAWMKGGDWAPGMLHSGQSAFSFVAQVSLRDGTLVTFDSGQPVETVNWPYRVLVSLFILLAGVIGVSLIAVRWATRPINALADAAEELGRNINRPPLAEQGPLEVVRAARAFNTMQARLIRYLQDRARILAAMSHDLKTPITRLRLRAELLEDARLREKFTSDLAEMESMVAATLDFMRGMESDEPVRPVDVTALLESLQSDMAEVGSRVSIAGASSVPFSGRPQALRRCLMNLLDNAVKYGAAAAVSVDDDPHRLRIQIRDEGPGLAPSELEKVFAPFYRVENSRSRETGGTGLGLTIARGIAEIHGGTLTLSNGTNGGLVAELTLPRGAPSA